MVCGSMMGFLGVVRRRFLGWLVGQVRFEVLGWGAGDVVVCRWL